MSAAEVRRDRVGVGGARSPLIEAGPREASEAVVFVHGNPGSSTDWTALVSAVGEYGRALAVDMPGFGGAHRPEGFRCEVASYADFLQGAMAQLGVERAHLVLHDFGGPFGLLWGLQHGGAWASAVLINIGVMPGYTWHKMAKVWRTPLLGELSQAWIPRSGWHRMMRNANPRGLPAAFVDKMYDDYDRETRRTVLELYRSTPEPGDVAEAIGAEIAKLRIPALVVWGAKDPFIGVRFAERQRDFFDVRDVLILPESGHWPFQDDPEAVAGAVVPFLRERISERDPRPAAG
ncbi:MAG TPA: alpha/beta hydrolase [Solirubrobacteraceae bacterium]|nr:alpha/beta hydrolase [Solirubrobacteraceae bacterium]